MDNLIFWALVFSIPIVAIVFSTIERIFRYRAMERMAERGQTIPPQIFDRRSRNPLGRTARGIWLICVGVAIAIFFWAMNGARPFGPEMLEGNGWLPVIGIFPFMLGIAQVLIGLLTKDGDRRG